ncbi:MAG: hypothetical protein IT244_10045 [Bacteroidia bacterium]|nr:hypothetical protein [Bacteroidia bacterium]
MINKSIKTLALLASFALLSAFSKHTANNFIGTFSSSASDPAQIKLTLNADFSYQYQDYSDTKNKINSSGTYALKGNKVVLENLGSAFHTVWTFDKNGTAAKSRKGLSFYRLCKQ